jgi:hypothetical protein
MHIIIIIIFIIIYYYYVYVHPDLGTTPRPASTQNFQHLPGAEERVLLHKPADVLQPEAVTVPHCLVHGTLG